MLKRILEKFVWYKNAFIYCLLDPTWLSDTFYIGKAKNKLQRRLKQHINAAAKYLKKEKTKSHHNYNWINKMAERNVSPKISAIKTYANINLYDLNNAEITFIRFFLEIGISLSNVAPGGFGGHGNGYILEQRSKDKISNSLKKFYENNPHPNLGRKLTAEQRLHLSKLNTGKKASAEIREKMSKINTGTGNGFYGKKHTDEAKIALSKSHSTLTECQIKEIKFLLIDNKLTHSKIGKIYNVASSVITRIKTGDRHSHVKIYDDNNNEIRVQDLPRNNPRPPITEIEAIKIKKLLAQQKLTQKEIAKMFNASEMAISNIKHNKRWAHINPITEQK